MMCVFVVPTLCLLQIIVNRLLACEPRWNDLWITIWQYLFRISILLTHLADLLTCAPRKPATPFSRSIHQKQLHKPIHHIVFAPRPVEPGSIVRNPAKPHPCGCSRGCG